VTVRPVDDPLATPTQRAEEGADSSAPVDPERAGDAEDAEDRATEPELAVRFPIVAVGASAGMEYEKLSREELVQRLRDLALGDTISAGQQPPAERLLHELQVHQLELEMQNRELREAQSALEESRTRYADLYDFAPVAYCTVDSRGFVEELNLTAAALFGRQRERAIARPLISLVRFENPQSFWHHLGACLQSSEPVVSEFRLILPDRIVHVQAISMPVPKLGDSRRLFRTAFVDITQRKRAEVQCEAAYASEQRLRSLLESLDRVHIEAAAVLAGPCRAGLHEVMDVIVRHACHIAGADAADLELRQPAEPLGRLKVAYTEPPADLPLAEDAYALKAQLRYGERTLADLTLTRAHARGPFAKGAQRALEMLAERLASSVEIARLRMVEARETQRLSLLERVDRELRHAWDVETAKLALHEVAALLVPEFAELCLVHLAHEETEGAAPLQRVVHADRTRESVLGAQLRDPALQSLLASTLSELASLREAPLLHVADQQAEGAEAPHAGLARALEMTSLIVAPLWSRERPLGMICFGRMPSREPYDQGLLAWAQEIAARCAAALDSALLVHELREAVQWRENLMAMISHDLKSPLSAITLSAKSLMPEQPLVERRSSHRQVELIRRSADHMHHMINDLLSASLLQAGSLHVELRRESACQLASEACELAAPLLTARVLQLERELPEDLPCVLADRDLIQRVFANLLGNAAKFTPRGGRVRVSASCSDDRVKYCVSDTGPGIPEEQRNRLFDRYWRGDKGGAGLGLGLYISKAIVDAHQGHIWVESGPGEGATFCFALRRCDPVH
jgi:PAS domain S-box-containing protein